MNRIKLNLGHNSYSVKVGKNILSDSGNLMKEIKNYRRAVVITDTTVNELYSKVLKKSLDEAGILNDFIVIEPGEDKKNLKTAEEIINKFVELKITRADLVITFGGGVISDLGGFVASIYQRGIDFVAIPTTLLAQVDASIGGKVGVNLSAGKNLVGSIKQPKIVITDVNLLTTMDDRVYRDGMGEVIKYACIDSESVFEKLEETDSRDEVRENILDIITLCISIKSKYVEKDEFDKGYRHALNFGHTIGHAIEKYYNYERYLHGEAVAIGMYTVTLISEYYGYTKEGTAERLKNLLIKYGLPYKLEMPMSDLMESVLLDKKSTGVNLRAVVIREIGEVDFVEVPMKKINPMELSKIVNQK